MENKKGNKVKVIVIIIVIAILSVAISVGGKHVYDNWVENNKVLNGVDISKTENKTTTKNSKDESDKNKNSNDTKGLHRRLDFNYLHKLSPNMYCWLYMSNPYIDLPIMQEQEVGSTYYLYHDYKGAYSGNGSLLTPKIPNDFDDAHRLIFGHNILGTTVMFSSLPVKFDSKSFAKEHPYVYLYYADRAERWTLWCACHTKSTDMIYNIPYTLGSDLYGDLLDHMDENKYYSIGKKPDVNTRITVLSTCTGGAGTQTRFYLAYTLDKVRYYKNSDKITD